MAGSVLKTAVRFVVIWMLVPAAFFFLAYALIGPRLMESGPPPTSEISKRIAQAIKNEPEPEEPELPKPTVKVSVEETRRRQSTPEVTVLSEGVDPADKGSSSSDGGEP
jgi:hypothetical protein